MRLFSLTPIAFSLLCLPAVHCMAEDAPLKLDQNLVLVPGPNDEAGTLFVEADQIEGSRDTELVATGNARMRRRGSFVFGDQIRYREATGETIGTGNIRLERSGDTIWGDDIYLRQSESTGIINNGRYQLGKMGAHGDSWRMLLEGEGQYRLETATLSTCTPGDEDWLMRANEIKLDYVRNVGEAWNSRLEMFGTPIMWWPWMDFSLNGARKSGFLAPRFGHSSLSGFELSTPYYWNIAPNMDMEITPRYFAKRGLALNDDFRYLEPTYNGQLQVEVINHDQQADERRYALVWHHNQQILPNLFGSLNIQKVSDDTYFTDFSNQISTTSQVNLPREGSLIYTPIPGWTLSTLVQRYQTLQDPNAPVVPPYSREPQILLNGMKGGPLESEWRMTSELVDFAHPTLTEGRRFIMNPSVSLPMIAPYGFITPKLGLHYTRYDIDAATTGGAPAYSTTRSLPTFSLDTGLLFDREDKLFNRDFIQTLEPRLFYVRIPYRDQSKLPNFDSATADFNFGQLFSENQFVGGDRINDANELTAAVTTRFLDGETGLERLRFAVGQRFYFQNQLVTLDQPLNQNKSSDIIFNVGGQLNSRLSIDSTVQYSQADQGTRRSNLDLRYQYGPAQLFNASFRYTRNTQKDIDLSAQWPLSRNWYAVAHQSYSLLNRKPLESLAGLEYNAGCWALRLVAQRFIVNVDQTNSGVFIQLELNGIAQIGSSPLELLSHSIGGYTKTTSPAGPVQSDLYR